MGQRVRETFKIDRDHRDTVKQLGLDRSEGFELFIGRPGHHVQKQLFNLLFLAPDLVRVALNHHGIGIDHRFQLLDAADVLANQNGKVFLVQRLVELDGHGHRAATHLEADFHGVLTFGHQLAKCGRQNPDCPTRQAPRYPPTGRTTR